MAGMEKCCPLMNVDRRAATSLNQPLSESMGRWHTFVNRTLSSLL